MTVEPVGEVGQPAFHLCHFCNGFSFLCGVLGDFQKMERQVFGELMTGGFVVDAVYGMGLFLGEEREV